MTEQITIKKFRFQRDDFIIAEACSKAGRHVYVGNLPGAELGEKYIVGFEDSVHPKFGPQRKITNVFTPMQNPSALPGSVRIYLMSGAIFGCGPSTAQKIYDTFGDGALQVIRDDYMRLTTIRGISDKKALQIHEGLNNAMPHTELMGIPGMTVGKAKKLYAKYGQNAINVLRETPYRPIYDIRGFSFKTVDAMALQGGFAEKDDDARIAAALTFILTDIGKEGHLYCSKPKLIERAEELLSVDEEHIRRVLEDEVAVGNLVIDNRAVYAKAIYNMECDTADYVAGLVMRLPALLESTVSAAIQNQALANEQREAVIRALSNPIFAITGGAGTGKTTVINEIAALWQSLTQQEVVLCAPTGKAARRMTEVTGIKAITCARLAVARKEQPSNALIICDEASMLDMDTAYDLVRIAWENQNCIVFVGDVNQLPPVGAGTFFRDLLDCGVVEHLALQICHRQFGIIAENANKIKDGIGLNGLAFDGTSMKFLPSADDSIHAAIDEYKKAVAQYGIQNVCLLLPFRRERGQIPATETANPVLRTAYNSNQPREGCKFADGDRVINLVNDPDNDIANGDVGTVLYSSKEDNIFKVEMDCGRTVTYLRDGEYQFDFAYALTIHKSQGSEYDCVIVVLTTSAYIMLERNLVYTAVTRGKKRVILVGEKKAYEMAVRTQKATKRNTKLVERIRDALLPEN